MIGWWLDEIHYERTRSYEMANRECRRRMGVRRMESRIVKECKCPEHTKHYSIKAQSLGGDIERNYNCTRCFKRGTLQIIKR